MKPKKRKKYLDPGTVLLIKQIFFGVLIFSSIALVITVVWYVTRLSIFTIDTVTVEGGYTIDQEQVKSIAKDQLNGTYFKLIPKSFTYFYPEENIFAGVNQVERIKDVEVRRASRKEVLVTFDEYIPHSLWCNRDNESECFFLDKTGYAFGKAPNLAGASMVRYYAGETDFALNTRPFLDEHYQNSKEFENLMSQLGWFVRKIEINSVGDIFYTLNGDSEIKANLSMSALDTITNLQTIINSEEFAHLKPGNFAYLDLRFGSRVFVNENINLDTEVISTSTEEVVIDNGEDE